MGKVHALRSYGFGVLLWAVFVGGIVHVQAVIVESTTEPFVAKASLLKGSAEPGASDILIAPSILSPVAYAGTVSSIGPGALSDANANWTTDQFNGPNGMYYIQFDSGLTADIEDTDAASKTLSFPGTLPEAVPLGSPFRIRRHLTLADLFGPNNEAGLLAGDNPSAADNILIIPPDSQTTVTLFYSDYPGYEGWYTAAFTRAEGLIIYPEQGLMVRRKTPGDLVLYLAGFSHEGPAKIPVFTGNNLLGTLQAHTSLTLADLNLYTGDPNTGVAAASNPAEADTVMIINPNSTTSTYFYSNFPGYEGWFNSTFVASDNVAVSPGTAFLLVRKAPRGLFHWNLSLD